MPAPVGRSSGAGQPCGVSVTTGGIAPASLQYDHLHPVVRVAGPRCLAGDPLLVVCRHTCHRLLPWLQVTFDLVPDAARPGSDQWPWSTAPATAPAGRLGRPGASDPGGVVRCALSLCRPRCVCVCGVPGHLAPVQRCAHPLCSVHGVRGHFAHVHRCARCVRHVCVVGGFVGDPPFPFLFLSVFFLSFCLVPCSCCFCSVSSFDAFSRLLIPLCCFLF